jgi:hypothetical protein
MSDIDILSFDKHNITLDSFRSNKILSAQILSFFENELNPISSTSHVPFFFSFQKNKTFKVPTENFYNCLNSSNSKEVNGFNPIATRFVSKNNYVERPPFRANVKYKSKNLSVSFDFSLWIPWTIFSYTSDAPLSEQCFIYFSNRQLCSYDDLYISSIYPNIFDDSRICFGNSFYDYVDAVKHQTSSSIHSSYVNYFFSGSWNDDISSIVPTFIADAIGSSLFSHSYLVENYPYINYLYSFNQNFIEDRLKTLNSDSLNECYNYIKEQSLDIREQSLDEQFDNYIYYLFFMSLLDLPQTLDFVEELISFSENFTKKINSDYVPYISTFGEIIKNLEGSSILSSSESSLDDFHTYHSSLNSIYDFFYPSAGSSSYNILNITRDHYIAKTGSYFTFVVFQTSDSISEKISFHNYSYFYSDIAENPEFLNLFHRTYQDSYLNSDSSKIIFFVEFNGKSFNIHSYLDFSSNQTFDLLLQKNMSPLNAISSLVSKYIGSSSSSFFDFSDISHYINNNFDSVNQYV